MKNELVCRPVCHLKDANRRQRINLKNLTKNVEQDFKYIYWLICHRTRRVQKHVHQQGNSQAVTPRWERYKKCPQIFLHFPISSLIFLHFSAPLSSFWSSPLHIIFLIENLKFSSFSYSFSTFSTFFFFFFFFCISALILIPLYIIFIIKPVDLKITVNILVKRFCNPLTPTYPDYRPSIKPQFTR